MFTISVLTILYLTIPTFCFFFGWLELPVAVFMSVGLAACIWFSLRKVRPVLENTFSLADRSGLIVSAGLFSLILCLVSEFGLLRYQSFDYLVHNFKFNLPATQPLPLKDEKYGITICYYLGFYLVPAFLGKILGLSAVKYLAFLWIWLGVFLSFFWIQVKFLQAGLEMRQIRTGFWVVLLIVGSYVNCILPFYHLLTKDPSVYNNAVHLNERFVLQQVPVFTRNLSESVQHTLPSILGIAVLLVLARLRDGLYYCALIVCSALFWTPFSTMGLFLFVAVATVREYWREPFSRASLSLIAFFAALPVFFSPVIIFLLSNDSIGMESNMLIWQAGSPGWFLYYCLYILSFWGVWFILAKEDLLQFDREALLVATVIFSLLALGQLGYYNDLNMRATIPAVVVMSLSVTFVVLNKNRRIGRLRLVLIVGFLLVNSLSAGKFFFERLFLFDNKGLGNSIEHPETSPYGENFFDVLLNAYPLNGQEVVLQYSMRKDSFFDKYLLKKTK